MSARAIKVALFDVEGERETCLAKRVDRLRQRDPLKTAEQMYNEVLGAGLKRWDIAYCATTGEGEGAGISHRSFLFDDDARPRAGLPAARCARRARYGRAARPRHPAWTNAARF